MKYSAWEKQRIRLKKIKERKRWKKIEKKTGRGVKVDEKEYDLEKHKTTT